MSSHNNGLVENDENQTQETNFYCSTLIDR